MTEIPGFVIHGAPRTKKNSSRVVNIGPMCRTCGKRGGFPKVLPSEAYEAWEKEALAQCEGIKHHLRRAGFTLPLDGPVSVEVAIYRERDTGDTVGFLQAVGDMLQAAGMVTDDRQIEDWDGSRRLKDSANPRVEVFITILDRKPVQGMLL